MTKPLFSISVLVFVLPVAAQHRGGGGVSHAASAGMHAGSAGMHGGFNGARAGFAGSRGYSTFRGRGYYPRFGFYNAGWGVGWPLYYDPYFYYPDSYGPSYDSGPYYDGSYGPPQGSPPVIINRQFQPEAVQPVMVEPPAAPPPPATDRPDSSDYRPSIYLLAFKDGVIRASVAYWVSGDSLHYVTRELSTRVVPLAQLDRDFSLRLNRERQVEFRLPHAN